MGRVAIFSDLHIHPFPAFGKPNEEGINQRLADIGDTLSEILRKSEEAKCDAVLFSGDFFHTKKLDIETLAVAARALKSSDIPIYAIPGNHDEARKMADIHSLLPFKGRVTILDNDSDWTKVGGFTVMGIPYLYYRDDLMKRLSERAKPDILLMHYGFSGALMGCDFILDCSETLSIDQGFDRAGLVVSGHFHQPQLFMEQAVELPQEKRHRYVTVEGRTILIPGAPVQHGFGDEGSVRGFWIYDGKSLEFNQLDSVGFVRTNIINAKDPKLAGKYVTFEADDPAELAAFVPPDGLSGSQTALLRPETNKSESRVDISQNMASTTVLQRYTDHQAKDHDPDQKKGLVEVGKVIMEIADED